MKASDRALSGENQVALLRKMLEIRSFEEAVEQVFAQGLGRGTTHLCIGQEAVAAGACTALRPDDYVTSTHRGHGHCIARGLDPRLMMAEIYGKSSGYCKGKGGSMHIADIDAGVLGANGIVGAGIPIAVGAALSAVIRESQQVVLCFFGDGAVAGGGFHEAVNLASVWDLPVVFLCENNQYAMSLSVEQAIGTCDIGSQADAYGIPGLCIDGNDVLAVYEATSAAVERAREMKGPTLIEAKTYRWRGHSRSDARLYRTPEEEEQWRERDPIQQFAERLTADGLLSREQLDGFKEHAARLMEEAVAFAERSPFPSAEELTRDIYVQPRQEAWRV